MFRAGIYQTLRSGNRRNWVRSAYCKGALIAAFGSATLLSVLEATAKSWNGGSGNWSVPGNWTPTGVPGAGDTVNIIPSGFLPTITYDYTGSAVTLGELTVNQSGNAIVIHGATLSMAANSLTTTGEFIGDSRVGGSNGFGTINQTGGTNTLAEVAGADALYLGYNAGDSGTYLLSGSGTLKTHNIIAGYRGRGTFSQSGGIVKIPTIGYGTVELGIFTGSVGSYSLSGSGSLSVGGSEIIGEEGSGSFDQSGGTNTITVPGFAGGGELIVGADDPGGSGTYQLRNGLLSVGSFEEVGQQSGAGTFTQLGGSHTIRDSLTVGPHGTFDLAGGSLSAGSIEDQGALSIEGGTLTVGDVTLVTGSKLNIGLLGPSQYGALTASGTVQLSGTLQVALDDYTPASGTSFHILDWGTLSGTFSTFQLAALPGGLTWNLSQLYSSGVISVGGQLGDYNHDGIVDAADYILWRDSLSSTTDLGADGNGDRIVDAADYNVWKANFGNHPGSGASSNEAVPEPTTLVLLIFAEVACCLQRCPTAFRGSKLVNA